MKRTRYIFSVILMIMFFIMISFVMLNDLFHFSVPEKVLVMEKRNLARKPIPVISNLDKYPPAYTRFYDDRFPFRLKLMDFYAGVINMKFFHRSPDPKLVELGKDGWMFYVTEGSIYRGAFMLSDNDIQKIADEVHKRAVYYHEKGIRFYLAVPPIKDEVYPEYLPRKYSRLSEKTLTDKILDLVRKDTLVGLVDMKSAVIGAKKHGTIYFKTDNHWNDLGAFYGYRAIIERISKDFPGLKALDSTDFTIETKPFTFGNMAQNLHVTDYVQDVILNPKLKVDRSREDKPRGYKPRPVFPYPAEFEYERTVDNPSLPTIMVVRDSYFNGMMPFITQNFRKSTILYDTFTYGVFDDAVQNEKPDIALYLISEPHMANLIGIIWW